MPPPDPLEAPRQSPPRRLHPLSPVATGVLALLRSWPILLIAFAQASWFILAVLAVVVATRRFLVWLRTTYSLGPEGLVVRSGILWRTTQTVPPQRVQQVEMRRGLRHRAIGLAVVRIGLAGGGETRQVELDSLAEREAQSLSAMLERWRLEHRVGSEQAADAAPAGEPRGAGDGAPLFRIPTGQLVIAGLTGRSLWLAPLAAAAGVLQFLTEAPIDDEPDDLIRRWLADASPALVIVTVMILALVAAAVSTILTNYRLVVTRAGDDVMVRRGLLETRSVAVPRNRVQFVEFGTNVVRERLDLASFEVRTADIGADRNSGESSTSVPIGHRNDLDALVGQFIPGIEIPDTHRHPPAAVRREVIRRLIRLVPLAAFLVLMVVGLAATLIVIGAAVGLVLAVATGWVAGRRRRSGWSSSVIVTQRGAIAWRRWVVPVHRIQSVGTSQNPFQRRLGLTSVRLDVAGSPDGVELRDLSNRGAREVVALVKASQAAARLS